MNVTVRDAKYRVIGVDKATYDKKELRERIKEFEASESKSEILELNLSEDELNDVSLSAIDFLVSTMVDGNKIDVRTIHSKNSVFLLKR